MRIWRVGTLCVKAPYLLHLHGRKSCVRSHQTSVLFSSKCQFQSPPWLMWVFCAQTRSILWAMARLDEVMFYAERCLCTSLSSQRVWCLITPTIPFNNCSTTMAGEGSHCSNLEARKLTEPTVTQTDILSVLFSIVLTLRLLDLLWCLDVWPRCHQTGLALEHHQEQTGLGLEQCDHGPSVTWGRDNRASACYRGTGPGASVA